MFMEIPSCSPDHIRWVVFQGSLPMPGSEVFRGITSRVFQKWAIVVGT